MGSTIETKEILSEEEIKICLIQSEWRNICRTKKWHCSPNHAENGDKFTFFWYDMFDFKPQQEISLLGKRYNAESNSFESCCVTTSRVHKTFYILPRETFDNDLGRPVRLRDVYDEFAGCYARDLGIDEFKSKVVVKRSVDKNVPFVGKYLEVTCRANEQRIEIEGGNTFSRILGTRLGFVQNFLLQRNIRGPCWLEVRNPEQKNFLFTKCKTEVCCANIDDISVINDIPYVPPFKILIFNIKTIFNKVKRANEICLISWIYCDAYYVETQRFNIREHSCGVHPVLGLPENFREHIKDFSDTQVNVWYTERDLLRSFLVAFERYEVDMLLSYDLTGKNLDILFEKIVLYDLKYSFMSCRRLKKSINKDYKMDLFCGKLLFNLKTLSEDLVKSVSYSLEELVTDILHIPYIRADEHFIRKSFEKSNKLQQLVTLTMWETYCVLDLAIKLNVIPFTLELTKICGTYWNATLYGTVSNLCEYLLLHAFHQEGYIIPDDLQRNSSDGVEETRAFRGGLVLDPKIGLLDDYIVAMDFVSLYPSIIRQFNLCFSTYFKDETGQYVFAQDHGTGVLPKVIQRLLDVRKLKKNADTKSDVQQAVIKKITNSLYGYMAYENSKFYSKGISEFIARSGREILMKTSRTIGEEFGFDIVYGDTDSVMFRANCEVFEDALESARKVRDRINLDYEHVKIEISAVYRPLAIFSKKRYAAIERFNGKGEVNSRYVFKGIEIVRRDSPEIAKKLQEEILREILTPPIDRSSISRILRRFRCKIEENNFRIEEFGITKKLNQNPSKYRDKNQPHVVVALSSYGKNRNFKRNDYITYVYCSGGGNTKVCHLDELKYNSSLHLDLKHYMESQVSSVGLILQHFGFTENDIRECLGLQAKNKYRQRTNRITVFKLTCVFCAKQYQSSLTDLNFLNGCEDCKIRQAPKNKSNYLVLLLRTLLTKYHDQERFCPNCQRTVNYISTNYLSGKLCSLCNTELSHKETVREILGTMLRTLQQNHLSDLCKIVRNILNTCKLQTKHRANVMLKRAVSEKLYTTCCVFCDKQYSFGCGSLDFLKPCPACRNKRYKNQENHLKMLLRKLTEKCYGLERQCDNLSCKAVTSHLTLKLGNAPDYCDNCNVGRMEERTKWEEVYDSWNCMCRTLEKWNLSALAQVVTNAFEGFEFSYAKFSLK